jgi:hypothetical protein
LGRCTKGFVTVGLALAKGVSETLFGPVTANLDEVGEEILATDMDEMASVSTVRFVGSYFLPVNLV